MSRDAAFAQSWFDQGRTVAYAALTYSRTLRLSIRGGVVHEFCPMPGTNPFEGLVPELVHAHFPNATSPLRIG